MGQQSNKVIKRKRRQLYLQRKVVAQAAVVKAKTAPKVAKPKAAKAAPKPAPAPVAAPAVQPEMQIPAAEVPVATEEHPVASNE